jgi:hypothetical protein
VLRDRTKFGFQLVSVETNAPDEEGCLVFTSDRLVEVLVRLSDGHSKKAGCCGLEHGFRKLDGPVHPIFTDLDEAQV